jgi:amidase
MFPIAHANDGGASIRVPASYCGLFGLKPSRGRVPRQEQWWLGAVVEGVVARTVADSAAVLDAIAGPDPLAWYNAPPPARPFGEEVGADPGRLRVGLMANAPLGIPTDDACSTAARAAAATLEELGHVVEEVEVPTLSEEFIAPFIVLVQGGLADYDGVDWSAVEPHVVDGRRKSSELGAYDYVLAGHVLERVSRRELVRWGRDFDVLLTPTSAILPPVAGSVLETQHATPEEPVFDVVASVSLTAFGNVTGQPAVSLPLHWTETGLPVGVQLVGGPWEEARLIALSAQLEEARPWADRRPPIAHVA